MKKMILAALLTMATAPAFAADISAVTDDQQPAVTEQSTIDQAVDENAFLNQLNEQSVDEQALPPYPGYPGHRPPPHIYSCYSRDLYGHTYVSQSWNRNMAANMSMRACRSRARLPFTCRFIGCQIRY